MQERRTQSPSVASGDSPRRATRRGENTGKTNSGSGLSALRSGFLTALWLALLFFPFKGIKAALILFASVLAAIISFKYLMIYGKPLRTRIYDAAGLLIANVHDIVKFKNALPVIYIPALLLIVSIPFLTRDYFIDVAVLAGIYIILAQGLNVVVGFAGLLNLGFVAFYAIGAYAYALLNTKFGLGFWPSLPISVLLATFSGFILAIPALRLRGDYLAIVTLGFGEIVRLVLNNWDSVTKGPNGISGIERIYLGSMSLDKLGHYYYFVLAFVFLTIFVVRRVRASRTGRAWLAIRENEIASSSIGINTTAYKLYAFAFGAFWAGLAGALFSAKMQFVSPESFTFMESVLILCMVILGGIGSIPGVVLGAIILVVLPEVLREVQMYRMLALGAGLVLLMIFRPQGLWGGRGVSLRS